MYLRSCVIIFSFSLQDLLSFGGLTTDLDIGRLFFQE